MDPVAVAGIGLTTPNPTPLFGDDVKKGEDVLKPYTGDLLAVREGRINAVIHRRPRVLQHGADIR
jgi:hypothetical protein